MVKGGRLVIIEPIIPTNLSLQKIQAALKRNASELGVCPDFAHIRPQFDLHLFDSLSSTNTQLWSLLAAGAKSGSVVIAKQQSAGRGQRGRHWQSTTGGLYLSLALEPDWPVSRNTQLTCLSAWGIATALNNLGIEVDIKWPNDLFFKGKKLGGILTETKLSQSPSLSGDTVIKQAVIGVGINWHNSVPETGINLVSILKESSPTVDKNKINCLEMLIAIVLKGILQGYLFQQQVGSQVFMKAYQKLLTQVGQTVSLDSSGRLSLAAPIERNSCDPSSSSRKNQWANRSGEVIGVSEEGYLQVALHPLAFNKASSPTNPPLPTDNILLFKPSEIHIS